MALIHCCGRLQKTKAFVCEPSDGYIHMRLDWLPVCKSCRSTVLQVTRFDLDHNISRFRRTEKVARELFDSLRTSIIYEVESPFCIIPTHSGSYLCYSEFGVKKRCYSSLSTLKAGLFESLSLPEKRFVMLSKKQSERGLCTVDSKKKLRKAAQQKAEILLYKYS